MTFVNLTNLRWRSGRMKRNLALFTNILRIAEFGRGIYINISDSNRKNLADYFRAPRVDLVASYEIGNTKVTVLQPLNPLPLAFRLEAVATLSGRLFAREVAKIIAGDPYVLWVNTILPIECGIASALAREAKLVVFDNSDDMLTLEPLTIRREAERRLKQMLNLAEKTICVSDHVFTQIEHRSKLLFRNCTTFDSLQRVTEGFALPPWLPKVAGRTYVGFVGSLAEDRVDTELLEYLFLAFPQVAFLFVGWVGAGLSPIFARHPNAHIVPEVSNEVLGTVIRSFDVGIIPHRKTAMTAGNDLLKLLDYNACGVPVVTTPVSGADSEYTAIVASTKEEFARSVQLCVDGRHNLDLARGKEYARNRSWEIQVPKLIEWLGLPPR